MKQISPKWQTFLIYTAIAALTLIAFEQIRYNEFICFDDNSYIVENPNVQNGITTESIIWSFTQSHAANWHPVTWLSHMLDCEIFGTDPYRHHLVNLLFHIINSLLLFLFLKTMTGVIWPCAFTALLFAIHPLHVESVAWASERKDVLSTFFGFLAILGYFRYTQKPNFGRYLLVFTLFAIGLMAKPMLVTLPFCLLVLDYWPLGRLQHKEGFYLKLRHLIIEKIPLFILTVFSGIITCIAQQNAMASVEKLSLHLRAINAVVSYIHYIAKMVYPQKLAMLYPHPFSRVAYWHWVVCFILLAIISAIVIFKGRRHRYLVTGWLWYLGTLVPVIGLVQVGAQSMADRYTYLPSVGIFIIIAWAIGEVTSKWRLQRVMLSIAATIVLTTLLIFTRIQVKYWKNSFTIFEHTLKVTKNNYIAHNNYGSLLCKEGDLEAGIPHLRKSVQINPRHTNALYNLGLALAQRNDKAEAIEYLNKALELEPDDPYTMTNLAYVLATIEDIGLRDTSKAVTMAKRACELTRYENPQMLEILETARKAAESNNP